MGLMNNFQYIKYIVDLTFSIYIFTFEVIIRENIPITLLGYVHGM